MMLVLSILCELKRSLIFIGVASTSEIGQWGMFQIELVAPQTMDRYLVVCWEICCCVDLFIYFDKVYLVYYFFITLLVDRHS